MNIDMQEYLRPTFFLDYHSAAIKQFSEQTCCSITSNVDKAVALYYAVRDQIRYDPFDLEHSRDKQKASAIYVKKSGYCVSKAVLLCALGRHQGIPSRLGFADVTNHLSSNKLRAMMETDLFVYHGYTEFFLQKKWVKATPAFNLSLCRKFKVKPLEFDGTQDSIFHEFDELGQKHMQYLNDHGHFSDLPFDKIFRAYEKTYPNFFTRFSNSHNQQMSLEF